MKVLYIITLGLSITPPAFAQTCPAQLSAGFRVISLGGVKTAVWYPSTAAESPYSYSQRAAGSVAVNAPPAACSRFPLIVFSHGFGGCGTQSVFITEQLSRKGYLIAAPDHQDAGCSSDGSADPPFTTAQEPFKDPEKWTDQTYVDRKQDIQKVLSAILAHPEFGPAIDPSRIAGMGHSLGGYTIFGMMGGWPSWKEPRLTAAVLLSPYMDPFLGKGAVPLDTLPTMYQGGVLDVGITPSLERAGGVFDQATSPKFFAKLPGGHLTWTNSTCDRPVPQCVTTEPAQSIDGTIQAFLDHYIKGLDRQDLWFRGTDLTVRVYRRSALATSVSAASFVNNPLPSRTIASAFSEGLTTNIVAAQSIPLPTSLGGLTANVTDAGGRQQNAQLFFVSPNQINFLVPAGAAEGAARVDVRDASDTIATGSFQVAAVAPALFSVTQDGRGVPAGQYILIRPDGSRADGFLFNAANAAVPLNVNAGQVYLVLYGTGMRNAGASAFTASVGNRAVPILSVAPSPEYPGLDQIAIGPLPSSLAGAGSVSVSVTAGGVVSNVLTVVIQ